MELGFIWLHLPFDKIQPEYLTDAFSSNLNRLADSEILGIADELSKYFRELDVVYRIGPKNNLLFRYKSHRHTNAAFHS